MASANTEQIDDIKCIDHLLWLMRTEDPAQYIGMVKMHLSFVTNSSSDQCDGSFDSVGVSNNSKWNLSPIVRKLIRGNNSSQHNVEGISLTQQKVCQAFQLIHFLNNEENLKQEGVFRKTGSLTRQTELKAALNAGENLYLDSLYYTAHDCASVLKSFLSELPEPLLQEGQYHVHCRIAEMCGKNLNVEERKCATSKQVRALRLVFRLLPPRNYQLLKDLLMLLHRVTEFQAENKMTSLNLGTMFAPHILCPRKMRPSELQFLSASLSTAVAFIIENAPVLFQVPIELVVDVRSFWRKNRIRNGMQHQLSKGSMEDAPTNTMFTFLDRELTAKANDKDVTEMALAELYAFVQSLPDSSKKRKLISQFNNVTGKGTPNFNHSIQKKSELKVKSLRDSIKKHLFNKSFKATKIKLGTTKALNIKRSKSDDILNKVMMTPRSRCPIIINSSSSLSSVHLHEGHSNILHIETPESSHNSHEENKFFESLKLPNISRVDTTGSFTPLYNSPDFRKCGTGTFKNTDVEQPMQNENICNESFLTNEIIRKSKISRFTSGNEPISAGSLLGGFFKNLSTSSLLKLASKLTLDNSLTSEQEDMLSPCAERSIEMPDSTLEESLSSVFKDYLLSRSILTDDPIDLSSDNLMDENSEANHILASKVNLDLPSELESSKISSLTPNSCNIQKGNTDILGVPELSNSLLFCLDGNNPLKDASNSETQSENKNISIEYAEHLSDIQLQSEYDHASNGSVSNVIIPNSCSANGFKLPLLNNKNGNPLHLKEAKSGRENNELTKNVLFETSL